MSLVPFAAVFWMSHNAPPKEEERSLGGALRDIEMMAVKETKMTYTGFVFVLLLTTLLIGS